MAHTKIERLSHRVRLRFHLVFAVLLCLSAIGSAEEIRFNRDIRPILSNKCFTCHGPDENSRESDLRFDVEKAVFDHESNVIVRGKPEQSELVSRIFSDDEFEVMPPPATKKPLTAREKELLRSWIAQGAPWEGHWSFLPPERPEIPEVADRSRVKNEIDPFVLRMLDRQKLAMSPEADRVTLARRLHQDLTGLPPTWERVSEFVTEDDPKAYEKLVEGLLESPHFGERMALMWLDIVRYADSNGYHSDEPRSVAPYRDYVIEAFNSNKPYDRFVVEQLAGDLLPDATLETRVGSGFNMLLQTTNEGGAQEKEYLAKYAADRVRNTSSIFLGITMGCSECHDHKFDPFSAHDFYSMAAFFSDIKERGRGNPPAYPVPTPEIDSEIRRLDGRLAELRATLTRSTPELIAAQKAWETKLTANARPALSAGPWHVIGPFRAANFDQAHNKAFAPEAGVDLKKKQGGQTWKQRADLTDGQVHGLKGDNSATYLFRVITVPEPTTVDVSLGSDDGFRLWLNGELAGENKVSRAVAPDQDRLTLNLTEGENRLLLKVSNGSGDYGFYFRLDAEKLPAEIAAILGQPSETRSDAERNKLAAYYRSIAPALDPVRQEITRVEAEKKRLQNEIPRTLMTVSTNPRPIRLLNRGNWMDDSGPLMTPDTPETFFPLEVDGRRANRLDLARWIVDRRNPLTARTFVNRLWRMFYGRGLATPLDDLGFQGQLPTHPELLDWLAVEFMESGWNVKHLVRLMVTSGTYRQSSAPTAELLAGDPANKWYARQPRYRLDAELVRDNALAISGLLVKDIGGPSVKPYQPAGYWRHMNFPRRTWKTGTGSELYRRGLYTWWQRMFLHPSLLAFDAPSREECTVERPRSNTPQQALVLLNDPTYVEAARVFAERVLTETDGEANDASFEARLNRAFRVALSREPRPAERSVLKTVFETHHAAYTEDPSLANQLLGVGAKPVGEGFNPVELASWTAVTRVILNLHETITRR